jgi:hypothetical protein
MISMRLLLAFTLVGCARHAHKAAGKPVADPVVWGKLGEDSHHFLALGLAIHGEIATAVFENRGTTPVDVFRDDVKVLFERDDGYHADIYTKTGSNRTDNEAAFTTLRAGARYTFDIDLHAIAHKIVDPATGAEALDPGTYRIRAVYEVDMPAAVHAELERVWSGVLEAGPLTVEIQ